MKKKIIKSERKRKKRCPKYGDREIEETKVNLDYKENINLIPIQENIKNENELIKNALLPINEEENDDNDNDNSFNYSFKKSDSFKNIEVLTK